MVDHLRCKNGHVMADIVKPELLKRMNGWHKAFGNWRGREPKPGEPWPKCPECGADIDAAH